MTRKGNLFDEKINATLSGERGIYDPAIAADCRCHHKPIGFVAPWVAMASLGNWDEQAETPDGLPDGDLPHYSSCRRFVPLKEAGACDLYGRPLGCLPDEEEERQLEADSEFLVAQVAQHDENDEDFAATTSGNDTHEGEEEEEAVIEELSFSEATDLEIMDRGFGEDLLPRHEPVSWQAHYWVARYSGSHYYRRSVPRRKTARARKVLRGHGHVSFGKQKRLGRLIHDAFQYQLFKGARPRVIFH